jgi:tetratricopeptide (TPR) repeat protein
MVSRTLALLFVAAFGSACVFAQGDKAMLDKTTPPPPAPAAQPSASVTAEDRGDIFMAKKMYREAIEAYQAGKPNDPILLNKIGIAYHQSLQLDSARRSYERAIKVKPDFVEAMNNLGTIYYYHKSYRRAIGWYNKAIKLGPNDAKAASFYMNRGTAWFARKQDEKMNQDYEMAMKLDPDVFEHHSNVGQILEERSVEDRARYHFEMAKLYAKSGRNELALQNLRKALEEGFKDKKKMQDAPEFATLKESPEFKELMTLEPRVL